MSDDDDDDEELEGFSDRPPLNWGLAEVEPDTIAAFEIGEKKQFLENLWAGMGTLAAGLSIGWSPQHIDKMCRDPEVAELVKLIEHGKDQNMEAALYRTGLTGNVTAQQVWLYNRRPDRWRDTKRVVIESEHKVSIEIVSSVREAALQLLEQKGVKALQPGGALDKEVIDVESEETDGS